MLAFAYFKILFCGPFAVYLLVVMVRDFLAEAGRTPPLHVFLGVVTRLIYAGIFLAFCADRVRFVRRQKTQ